MLSKLNGWYRIGVVLTALWTLSSVAWVSISSATNVGPFIETIPSQQILVSKGTPDHCLEYEEGYPIHSLPASDSIFDELENQAHCKQILKGTPRLTREIPSRHVFLLGEALAWAFIPPATSWLLCLSLVAVIRWIAAGFRSKQGN